MRIAAATQSDFFPPLNWSWSENMTSEPSGSVHVPVLLEEVLHLLQPQRGGLFLDATVGLGGHASAILDAAGRAGHLLGIDRDAEALNIAAQRLAAFRGQYQLVQANFSEVREIAAQQGIEHFQGILADLGVSSLQLASPERGFSFQKEGPLDMRMDQGLDLTAAEVVNRYPERDLANLIFRYGEERHSRRIAREIVKARPLRSTKALADVIAKAVHSRGHQRIHPATRTFQALRIFVNEELTQIPRFIEAAADLLASGGRIAIISFHSLEDRAVKECFRRLSQNCVCPPEVPLCRCGNRRWLKLVTKKPVVPSQAEMESNPRSRSAKLRVAEKI
jgi:16S rRNA (cytosine1402-N4)-methyltransferase